MNRELQNIASCFTLNKHTLWFLKTKRKKFKETTEIEINGQIINQVKCTKFLGLNMDEELSRKDHIDQVAIKISKMTGIMSRARHHLTIQSLKTIYNTMVYPYLKYCCITWTSTYPTRLKSILPYRKKCENNDLCKVSRWI